jgi:hypothetical protein
MDRVPGTSVFQGLSGGKIEQLADVGVRVGRRGGAVSASGRAEVGVALDMGVFVVVGVAVR